MPRGSRGRGRGAAGSAGGRGRGGSRGRGRSGRGGRGGWRGRGGAAATNTVEDWDVEKTEEVEEVLNIDTDLKKYFVGTASFNQHYEGQDANKTRYAAGMAVLDKNGVEISQNARVRALAAAWSRKDHDLARSFLMDKTKFGLVEVLKAVTLLDASRCIRVEEKKLKRLQMQNGGKVKPRVVGNFKSKVDNLTAIKTKHGSASGAVCKHIRRWVKRFTPTELEFYALHYPAEPWKKLADICHFNPTKDFSLPWFLPYCYGSAAPDDSPVHHCKSLTAENVNDLLKEFDLPYTHVKSFKDNLVEESKAKIAATDKINQIIWWYEDLQCGPVDEVLNHRLKNGGLQELDLPYGKLMERLLTIKMIREDIPLTRSYSWLRTEKPDEGKLLDPTKAPFYPLLIPIAQARLKDISLNLESPVVIIGDKSSSMDVAIRTSTIISSLLTAITSAKLVFFNNTNHAAQFIPTNIEQVLEMAVRIQATGSTAPAASLYPFYARKEIVKTFIMVTDEEENTSYKGFKFLELYKKYREEVYSSRLVFVSFLRSQHAVGQMVSQLERSSVPVMQFTFDQQRPDLTKLDTLFGLLSSDNTSSFEDEVTEMGNKMRAEGLQNIFEMLNMKEEELKNKKDDQNKLKNDDKTECSNDKSQQFETDMNDKSEKNDGDRQNTKETPMESTEKCESSETTKAEEAVQNDKLAEKTENT